MVRKLPFTKAADVRTAADEIWWSLTEDDWLEAFSKHPKIGEQSAAKWSVEEQLGMASATNGLAREMNDCNSAYYAKFGFIFIVCATGRSAREMLDAIKIRMENSRADEIQIAAGEQAKITQLRLEKLAVE